jgi:uncharacterized protein (TIGR03437 family)
MLSVIVEERGLIVLGMGRRFRLHPFRVLLLLACVLPPAYADYATYIGDTYSYHVAALATDAAGNTYLTGSRTIVAGQPPLTDVFVSKVDPSGNVSLLATLSGKATDAGESIAIDASGNIYIAGNTNSPDFPLHLPLQSVIGVAEGGVQQTGFLAKLSPNGAVLYSTFLGGTNGPSRINAIAADAQGNAYVTGETFAGDYPRTAGLPAAGADGPGPGSYSAAFFAKISPAGDKVLYAGGLGDTGRTCGCCSSCFLSTLSNAGLALAVDAAGNAYIACNTNGGGMSTAGALVPGGVGPFIAKVNASGTGMVYVTYLGAGDAQPGIGTVATDSVSAISADAAGNAYITGSTADPNFPATPGAFQTMLANPATPPFEGPPDAFVAKLNSSGSAMVWATFLGGSGADQANTIAVDPGGDVWVSGTTQSTDFPVSGGFPNGGEFLVEFNPAGSSILYGARFPADTVAAALAIDSKSVVHAAGPTGLVSTITPELFPAPRLFGLANAAGGNLAGRVAPGELISIYGLNLGAATPVSASFNSAGFLPTTLGGLQVNIDGILAPMLYVSDTQINAVAPFELEFANSPVLLTITGVPVGAFRMIIDQQIPEVFHNANGYAAAINQDGTVNSAANPAKAGSTVSVWATGVGWNSNGVDGQQQTSAQSYCSCTIQDLIQYGDIAPSYAGAAPGMVNGIVQINFPVMNPGDFYSLAGSSDPFWIYVAP